MDETYELNTKLAQTKKKLLSSLLLFTRTFYKLLSNRDFELSYPIGRESHQIDICRELTKCFKLETNRLLINVPPGCGKSTFCCFFIAWCYAHYADCNFLYISYSQELAAKHTFTIKRIMSLPEYRELFGVELRSDSSAKDNFQTTAGGMVKAFGSKGPVTGQDGGLPGLNRFSGCVLMDDMHKPNEVHSDTIRESVLDNYKETIKPRPRGPNVPIIFIGQRLHEADLGAFFINKGDGYDWKQVVLRALDDAGNALCPAIHSKEMLEIEREVNSYVFWSQYQQEPQAPGGSLYKRENFVLLEEEPEILVTFITADSAETEKEYNDATVFEHWGLYRIQAMGVDLELYGLHLIDCVELRIEPKDLEFEFTQFYAGCLRHKVKPTIAAIEKKSTGVTLVSTLKGKPGLQIIEIERTAKSGSKGQRFIDIQPIVASKRISLMSHGKLWSIKDNKPYNFYIEHMCKITANNTHRWDDICDATYDACKIALVDELIPRSTLSDQKQTDAIKQIYASHNHLNKLRQQMYGTRI